MKKVLAPVQKEEVVEVVEVVEVMLEATALCCNVMPAGWQICRCKPTFIRLSVRLLMHSYLCLSLNWHSNVCDLDFAISGNFCSVKVPALVTS